MLYNNSNLLLEKTRVLEYLDNRSSEKRYPKEYMDKIFPLLDKMYEVSQLSKINYTLPKEFQEVLNFAKESHKGQERRFINLPYIVHPLELATRLIYEDHKKEAVYGALLHDVVEDCGVTYDILNKKFGKEVSYYVFYLTDIAQPNDGNREARIQINFEHFIQSDAASHDIKLTDLISNTRSLVFCDPRFSQVYIPELQKIVNYFQTVEDKINSNLFNIFKNINAISQEMFKIQKQYNIPKLESKKPKLSF